MPNSIASTSINGRNVVTYTNQVARTDTTAKDLFVLESGDIPIGLSLYTTTASDAGTSALLSVGSTGNAAYFGSVQVVSGTHSQLGVSVPSTVSNLMAPLDFQTTVTATYAEYGSASSEGGPWTVLMDVIKK
jgi:hypothetical protein